MAIIYRLDEGADEVPLSEIEALRAFGALSDEWVILHSVRWQSVRNGRQGDGEADFVIAHRLHGVIVLEIKGGEIGIQGGQWQSKDRRGKVHSIKNPYTQATQSKHALLRFLAGADVTLSRVPIVHAVGFTDVQTDEILGPSATRGITLFSRSFLSIEDALLGVFAHWGASRPISSIQLEQIVGLLAPTVTVQRRLVLDIERTESELLRLTTNQQRAFARLRGVSRLLISGGPGTGKTIMAVERAKGLALQAGRVLVVCYNELLSRVIRHQLEDVPGVEVATFHGFCISQLRSAGQESSATEDGWWEIEAATVLKQVLHSAPKKYDAIIVDEGQDFSPHWFEALLCGLADGQSGQMYVFADDRQELWSRNWRDGLSHFGEFELLENCRNSAPISKCMNAIYESQVPTTEASGVPVVTIEYQPGDDLVGFVVEIGENLLTEHSIDPSGLTILTDDQSLAERLRNTYVGSSPIVPFGRVGITCETVARFKGLESSAVVLVLTGRGQKQETHVATAYVGLSRARAVAVVVTPTTHPAASRIRNAMGRK